MENTPSSPVVSIRPISSEELSQVLEIERRVHVAPWGGEHFSAELEKAYSHVWVLTDDETDSKILGYAVFWALFDDVQLLNIAVDLPYRGLGYAKKMIQKLVAFGIQAGFKRILLDVRKGNHPAIQLYQSAGFTVGQIRKGFYSDGEDAYQMSLPLVEDSIRF
jgi:ribosomal-protein-alanine N-acetyltransferase